jgi:hypothetical protein
LNAARDGAVVFDQKDSHGSRSYTMGWARLRVAAASRNCLPFFTAAPSESYQQSFYAKRCTAPRRAAILLRPDMPKFPASRTPPRDQFPARPFGPCDDKTGR